MTDKVIKAIEQYKIIAILRGIDDDKIIPTAEALYNGGIRLLELTYSNGGNLSDEKTAENIKKLTEHFKGRLYIGAGTVLSTKQVELTKKANGLFIISPNTDEAVITETKKAGLVSIPGALTPSEIVSANKFGADFVKLFPITSLKAEYVKAVKAPLANIKMLAVGGINEKNMKEYLECGVSGFGIGSNITDKKMIMENNFCGITALAKKYTEVIGVV